MTAPKPPPPLHVVGSMREPREDDHALEHGGGATGGLVMVCAPAEARRRLQELQAFVKEAMVEGVDFMTLTEGRPPVLLQPGAQKLAEMYGLAHRFKFTRDVEDWSAGFFYYLVTCQLTWRGALVGEGIGSANSRETKYASRWKQAKDVPPGLDLASLPRESRPSKFANGRPYDVYLCPNEAPCDLVNTLQKMACKRALVHAVLGVTRSSGLFTQDLEDVPAAHGVIEEDRPWERNAAPAPTPAAAPPPPPPAPVKAPPPSSNAYASSEQKAMRELEPAVNAATTQEEVEALRKEAVAAAPPDPANPRKRKPTPLYLAWYQTTFRAAQIRVGAA